MSRRLELTTHVTLSVLAFALVLDITSAGAVGAALRFIIGTIAGSR
ncbi:MAG: hypothetical protein ACOYLQ_09580 [Hyphomicrobiaceae bacterium]